MYVVVCEELSLDNGNLEMSNGNREGSVVTHTCNEGFTLSGDAVRTCQSNGEWTGFRITCIQSKTSLLKYILCDIEMMKLLIANNLVLSRYIPVQNDQAISINLPYY